ncbi:MAG: hypothetical protein Q8N31_23445 [Reyranella sp.]|nr:hypothetical protein [Reyranella sp.]MDP3162979.1 hypothetical protein [Reyranella sp.]
MVERLRAPSSYVDVNLGAADTKLQSSSEGGVAAEHLCEKLTTFLQPNIADVPLNANGMGKGGARRRMNRYFFDCTNELHDSIVSLHDFILPTATALWHFRQVVQGEIAANPAATAAYLAKKFNSAPGTRGTTNLITPFQVHQWEAQRERLAEVALVNVIALYEIWCEAICDEFQNPDLAIKLQFNSNPTRSSGIGFALDQLRSNLSSTVENSLYRSLTKVKKYSLPTLEALLLCYRYFKELRNCYMHRGRHCDGKLYGAQSKFIPIATKSELGMDFVPEHKRYQLGDKIELSLHGVLGFTEVILRIVTTVDAELAATKVGEGVLISRMIATVPTPKQPSSLKTIFNTMGFQGVPITTDLTKLLRRAGIII